MKTLIAASFVVAAAACWADDAPKATAPTKEHNWLKQLEGEWVTDCDCIMEPGKPPMKFRGTESTRTLGGLWSIGEWKNDMNGTSTVGMMTLGYEPTKKKFIGTWVSTMDTFMCKYEGTLSGNTLTLETEMPNPMAGGKMTKMKDVIEIKDKDHKLLTSYAQGDDGKWVSFMTMKAVRKK
jgi:hypothetical protein